jgi:glutaminyl-peptide cyclotransferase
LRRFPDDICLVNASRLLVSTLILIVAGCQPGTVPVPDFDGARAYTYLKDQVAFGPRVPGTKAWADCRNYCVDHFRRAGLAVDTAAYSFKDPYSGLMKPLVNIVARYRGGASTDKPILLVAHYDSRPRAEEAFDSSKRESPIDGANDGASGVAIVMELANLLKASPPHCNIDLLLVDGEDWGKPSDLEYYFLGSKAFVQSTAKDSYRFALLLDMVGDADLQVYREAYSEQFQKPLNDMVWNAARDLGVTAFHDSVRHAVIDDHIPLNLGGIRAIDIIDFDYPYWHTEKDTPDKCSPESLRSVGRVVAQIAYRNSSWPKN